MDGPPQGPVRESGFRVPTLVFLSLPIGRGEPFPRQAMQRAAMWKGIATKQDQCSYVATVGEISHLSFADFYAVVPKVASKFGKLSGDRLYSTVDGMTHAFLTEAFAGRFDSAVRKAIAPHAFVIFASYGHCDDGN